MAQQATHITVSIVTPVREILNDTVDEVHIPGVLGEVGILPQHTPLFTLLSVGKLTLVKGGQKKYFVVNGGFAEISQDRILILTETCERAEDIDRKRALNALADSEKALLESAVTEGPEYKSHWDRVRRARSRVEVADIVS